MIVTVTRSGGFGGLRRTATIDTSTIEGSRSPAVEKALIARRKQPDSLPRTGRADQFVYTVRFDDGSLAHVHEAEPGAEDLIAAFRHLFR